MVLFSETNEDISFSRFMGLRQNASRGPMVLPLVTRVIARLLASRSARMATLSLRKGRFPPAQDRAENVATLQPSEVQPSEVTGKIGRWAKQAGRRRDCQSTQNVPIILSEPVNSPTFRS